MIAKVQKLSTSLTARILAMIFAGEFILIYPLYVIMFGDRGHVDASGVGIILAVGFVLVVLFDIPTGIIADKVSRKYIIVANIICKIIGLLIWLVLPFFWGYILAAVFFSLSIALESGALQAYLYGTLGDNHKDSYSRFWGQVSAMIMVSYTTAYALAALVGVHYPALLICSIVAVSVALLIALTLPKDTLPVNDTDSGKPKVFKSALAHIIKTPALGRLLLSAIIIVALSQVVIEYTQVYFRQSGVPLRYIAIVLAASNLTRVLLFWTLHLWEHWLDKHKILLTLIIASLFSLSFLGNTLIIVLGMVLMAGLLRVLQVQFEAKTQHLANDEARATIASIGSFGARLSGALMLALIGTFAVNNIIARPFRIALLTGLGLFVVIQVALRTLDKRQRATT